MSGNAIDEIVCVFSDSLLQIIVSHIPLDLTSPIMNVNKELRRMYLETHKKDIVNNCFGPRYSLLLSTDIEWERKITATPRRLDIILLKRLWLISSFKNQKDIRHCVQDSVYDIIKLDILLYHPRLTEYDACTKGVFIHMTLYILLVPAM